MACRWKGPLPAGLSQIPTTLCVVGRSLVTEDANYRSSPFCEGSTQTPRDKTDEEALVDEGNTELDKGGTR
jgi:hypothetical protein